MKARNRNYSNDNSTMENYNNDEKYSTTGESEFSRDLTIPFDENEVLSERHYVIGEEAYAWERELDEERRMLEKKRNDFSGKGPRGYRRSDEKIYEQSCETLWRSPHVDPSEIEVSVQDGIIKLKGTVHKREFKRWAERLLDNIPGVVDIQNEIKVVTDKGGLIQNRTSMM
jgi:hypothetical protein